MQDKSTDPAREKLSFIHSIELLFLYRRNADPFLRDT